MVFNGKACARLCAGDAFSALLRYGIAEIAFHLYAQTFQKLLYECRWQPLSRL